MLEIIKKVITIEEIKSMPAGRVLKRLAKARYKVTKPMSLKSCSTCNVNIVGNSVKLERGGGVALLVLCPFCAAVELNQY